MDIYVIEVNFLNCVIVILVWIINFRWYEIYKSTQESYVFETL